PGRNRRSTQRSHALHSLPRLLRRLMTIRGFQRIHSFVEERLRHPDNRTVNLLNGSVSAWLRYYEFLNLIRDRYGKTSTAFVAAMKRQQEGMMSNPAGPRRLTQDEWEEMQRNAEIGRRLHLEIESFYIFANILLDRVASTFRFYFWGKPNWNHMHLATNLRNICVKKSLRVPDANLLQMPADLQEHIVEYRNKRIEHVEEPRLHFGTVWDGSGK